MIIAYIAHPIGGDVQGNLKKINEIVRHINLTEPDVVPFVPYYADIMAMNDDAPEERVRSIKNDTFLLKKGFINEIRLYGTNVSNGMRNKIQIAFEKHIPVKAMTPETKKFMQLLYS